MLKSPPSLNHLSRMYFELASLGARAVGEKKSWPYFPNSCEQILGLAAEMSRYDPRLLGILVEYFYFHWQKTNPLQLRGVLKQMNSPQCLAVIVGFPVSIQKDKEYIYFYDYITKGLEPVTPQLYFINLYQPGSHNMMLAAQEPIEEFRQWGYLARERPVIHGDSRLNLGYWGVHTRQNLIKRLMQNNSHFSIKDYLQSLNHTISRQQALQDLKEFPGLKMHGKGRGSYWKQKSV